VVIPATPLGIILSKMLLSAYPVEVVAGLHPLIVTTPVVIKPVVIIPELIMVRMIHSSISGVITTVPMTVKSYPIISCTIIIIMHKWPGRTNFEPAGISPVKITVCTGQVGR
jgi:hypothetical protein